MKNSATMTTRTPRTKIVEKTRQLGSSSPRITLSQQDFNQFAAATQEAFTPNEAMQQAIAQARCKVRAIGANELKHADIKMGSSTSAHQQRGPRGRG